MDRPYIFYELTNSVCATCLRKVEAKVIIQDEKVYLVKHCPEHKQEKVLISTDAAYYKLSRGYLKPGQLPLTFNTPIKYGCPYDCGLCPDHEQHSCIALVEVTDHCNLQCPICYAESSPKRVTHRTLEQIEFMLDRVVENEGKPDVVQLSGGEPTVHPQFFEIIEAAKRRPIKHLMLNTNGIRISQSDEFTARLASYKPGLEVYLQFDSMEGATHLALRGEDLTAVRMKALERLNKHDVSTTLVVTLKKGLNDHQIGKIIDFALTQPCVRGVTFQPIQDAGRTEQFDPATDRLTLGEVRQEILKQHKLFAPEDIIPVPCHPDCIAMGYALKMGGQVVPLTSLVGKEALLGDEGGTIIYERDPKMHKRFWDLFSTGHSPDSRHHALQEILCCLPKIEVPEQITYRNLFRVIIMQFLDPHNFDVRSVKRSCVHIVHPDGRIIPFDTYNMFYRDGREKRLDALKALIEPNIVAKLPAVPA